MAHQNAQQPSKQSKQSKKAQQPSEQTRQDAERIAKGIQKPGQTKEQTRLIAQGIEKGIALYKKQHKAKQREQDKQRKAKVRQQARSTEIVEETEVEISAQGGTTLPWILLALSWLGFSGYLLWDKGLIG